MHNRRFSALLMGGWLLGTILTWFATSQSTYNVERILHSPPAHLQTELDQIGSEKTRAVLTYHAAQFNRRITESWEILQLGLAGAFAACAIFTSARSRTMVVCSFLLLAFASVKAFYLTPSMTALAATLEVVAANTANVERSTYHDLQVWHRVAGILSTTVALVVSARLLFDFYELSSILPAERHHDGKRRPRSKRVSSARAESATPQTGVINEAGTGSSQSI